MNHQENCKQKVYASQVPLQQLLAHITQRQFVHIHRWRPNDLVMWDNRCTMHRGT
ncbi:MAG TPA: TauD/TfdA family dioxygenase, partial [Burkholderiales bacterium]|nr:TauD/TfdA family dioxygenase [Burkholderiales bacterium]